MSAHLWLVGRRPLTEPTGSVIVAGCHQRLRGPYSGVGTLLRALVPSVHERWPDLVRRHSIEILTIAPELRELIGAAPETLTSLAIPTERTRLYPANRTRRLAHGIVEFLRTYATAADPTPEFRFTQVEHADHTDQEFLAIAVRRIPAGLVTMVVQSGTDDLPDELLAALRDHTHRQDAEPVAPDDRDALALLAAYVDSDGTSDDPAELAAYDEAEPAYRSVLHTARAQELSARGEFTLTLGAIPYHLEHSSDPDAGATALLAAADYCISMGFYRILLDYVPRGLALTDPVTQQERYCRLSTKASVAYAVTGRSVEAEAVYLDLRSRYALWRVQLSTSYPLAMLYTRMHPPERKDHRFAKTYLNNAIALASLLPDADDRAFHTVFHQNGLALVEMHLGNLTESLRLVTDGLARLDAELDADTHRLHRSVLAHNRARVYVVLGRLAEALADFDTVVELDPNYPDYYFDRADALRKLGQHGRALRDYDRAIRLGPPFYELHVNRADLRIEVGDLDGAAADLRYVLDLEPDQLDSRVNLIGLLLESDEPAQPAGLIDEGLRRHPGDARLLHARALLALEHGETAQAAAGFDAALAADPDLVPALASRAALAHESGEHAAAIADLTRALDLDPDNPDLRYNRAFVHQAAGNWTAAVADYGSALGVPGVDEIDVLERRGQCYAQLGDLAASQNDHRRAAALVPTP